jgi:chromosome partitioning protein
VIISCLHIKGGVGKSTIAANLAVMRNLAGERILLVDADQQGTISDWGQHRQNLGVATGWTSIRLNGAAVRTEILKLSPNYDTVIIDVGGRDTQSLRAALSVTNIALIPCPPRSFDLWSMEQIGSLIVDAKCINPDLRAMAFINFGDAKSADNVSAKKIIEGVDGIELLDVVIGQRKAFVNASADGLGVVELRPKQSKAVSELETLSEAIFSVTTTSV